MNRPAQRHNDLQIPGQIRVVMLLHGRFVKRPYNMK